MDVDRLSRMAKSNGLSFSMLVTEGDSYAIFLAPPSWDTRSLDRECFAELPRVNDTISKEPIVALSIGSRAVGYYRLPGADWSRTLAAIKSIGFTLSREHVAL